MPNSNNKWRSPPSFDLFDWLPNQTISHSDLLDQYSKMGQNACCESDANDPKQTFDNTKPIMTTPPRSTRRSQRNTSQSPKYLETTMQPTISAYVREKLRTLDKYSMKNSSRVKGEARPSFLIESTQAIYKGEWKDDEPHGIGELFFKDGSYYHGTFAHGFAHGDGRYIFARGSYYEGQVRHNVAEGKGTLVNDNDKYTYSGEWLNDLPNGQGEEKWEDGAYYKGDFLNGAKHGKGSYRFSDGTVYEGYFKQDLFQGEGILKLPTGQYKGSFQQGRMEGRGVFRWNDGSVYEGQYRNNRKHGRGKYISAEEGKSYEGDWQNGVREGSGNLTNELGQVKSHKWNHGQLMDN